MYAVPDRKPLLFANDWHEIEEKIPPEADSKLQPEIGGWGEGKNRTR